VTPIEVANLNRLLGVIRQWSRGAEARAPDGSPVLYADPEADSWSLDGAFFRVMGPARAMEQMVSFTAHMLTQSERRFLVSRNPAASALCVLKDYNDLVADFLHIRMRLRDLPVEKKTGITQ
jgi:hypothetical protein